MLYTDSFFFLEDLPFSIDLNINYVPLFWFILFSVLVFHLYSFFSATLKLVLFSYIILVN